MGFYYALKFIEPAIVSSLEMGVGPFFAIVVTAMVAKQKIQATRAQWIITVRYIRSQCIVNVDGIIRTIRGKGDKYLGLCIGDYRLCFMRIRGCTMYNLFEKTKSFQVGQARLF